MRIITVGNTKGGVGKSTVATNLAVEGCRRGQRTLLIDTDLQQSSMSFRAMRDRDDLTAMTITTPTLHKDLRRMEGYDLIVIDTGGRFARGNTADPAAVVFKSALMATDILLIPMQPSIYEVWAAQDTLDLLCEARVYREDLLARFIMNGVIPRRSLSRDVAASMKKFEDDAPVMDTHLHYTEEFKKSVARGLGVVESAPGSKPAKEIMALFDEVMNILKGV